MKSILVLDDDADIRALLQRYLSEAGYDVALAADAAEARARLAQRRSDLIIADISMPQVSGVEFVAGLREERTLGAIPVIYLTALEENTELAVKTLGFPLLSKPVERGALLALVARQLARPSVAA